MILDTIENLMQYEGTNPCMTKVNDFLSKIDTGNIPIGKVEIEGENLFTNFIKAHGKQIQYAKFETHDRMIDIQIVFNHEEEIGWIPRTEQLDVEYHESDDFSLYSGVISIQTIKLIPDYFALFFPKDCHAPCI